MLPGVKPPPLGALSNGLPNELKPDTFAYVAAEDSGLPLKI